MTTFNKKTYIDSMVWHGNPFLVQPENYRHLEHDYHAGAKVCTGCNQEQYSTWFFDLPEPLTPDNKLPVCIECWRAWSKRQDLMKVVFNLVCEKCHKPKPIYMFGGDAKRTNQIVAVCADCKTPTFKKIVVLSNENH